MSNILILSAGTRNKIVQAFVNEMAGSGKVVAADCSPLAPALYDADETAIIPRMGEPGYLESILKVCREKEISAVFSLIDPELSVLAKNREAFEAVGTVPVVSPYELCEACLDKLTMYELLKENSILTARCWTDLSEFMKDKECGSVSYPVFVKPRKGSASLNINRVENDETIRTLFDNYNDLMIQEFMEGQEYGCDLYVDLVSGKCTSLFLKKKIRMRAGETDKSVSVKAPELFAWLAPLVEKLGFKGMVDCDLFLNDGKWYLSEFNPRFGGGYPHAYACGVNFPAALLRNLRGEENPVTIGDYEEGIYMMKYNEIKIVREDELVG